MDFLSGAFQKNKRQYVQEWTKQKLWKTAFKQFEGVWSVYIDHNHFNFFKGCFPRNLFGPILNTMTQMLFN